MVTRANASPELIKKLEGIKEIKRQYPVTTLDAYHYQEALQEYDALRGELCRLPQVSYQPTLQEVITACHRARHVVGFVLAIPGDLLALEIDPTSPSIKRSILLFGENILPFPKKRVRPWKSIFEKASELKPGLFLPPLRFDYKTFLTFYFQSLSHSLREEMVEGGEDLAIRRSIAIFTTLHEELTSDHKYLEIVSTGKGLTFIECLLYRENRRREREKKVSAGETVKMVEQLRELLYVLGTSAEIGFLLAEAMVIKEEETSLLLDWVELYERARSELTLRCLETERRIILSHLLCSHSTEFPPSPSELISSVEKLLKEWLIRLEGGDLPTLLVKPLPNEKEIVRYLLVALRKNRPWLIEFFNR